MTLVVTKGDGSGTQTVKTLDDVVGTAGTANAGVLSIQGIASGTDVQVKLSAGTAIAGKFTTDQTTHGTTDLVAADITKVAGAAISQGHGTAATAIRVELPTDGTGVVGLIAGTATIGNVINVPTATATAPTLARLASAATTNATSVKASAGNLYRIFAANNSGAVKFLKLYNKASSPTVGTDTPVTTIAIPANSVVSIGLDFPMSFATGIAYAITGAVADNDTTAVAANDVHGFLQYL